MPNFRFSAIAPGGQKEEGVLSARSRSEAFALLSARRLQPVTIREEKTGTASAALQAHTTTIISSAADGQRPRLNSAQQLLFIRELVELLEAGLQLEQALGVMESREERSAVKLAASAVRSRIREGASFSKAICETQCGFSQLFIGVCAAGEASGALTEILKSQADFMAFVKDLEGKLISALIYPSIVLLAGVGLLLVFMTFLLPQLTTLLGKTGQKLPIVTRMLVAASDWFGQWWWTLLLAAVVLFVVHRLWVRTPGGRRAWDAFLLRIPLVGNLLLKRFLAQFLQTLATLVINGVVLLNALSLVRGTFGNTTIDAAIEKVSAEVAEGSSLSRSMKKQPIFPPALIDIVRIGEQTGDIGGALERGARKYDREFTIAMQRFSTLIQPLSILIVAVFVGVVAYAMITGILTTVSGLRMR